MRGNRTVKVDNASLDAFDSPNLAPLARMAIGISVNQELVWRPKETGPLRIQEDLCRDVGLVRFFPSIPTETVGNYENLSFVFCLRQFLTNKKKADAGL